MTKEKELDKADEWHYPSKGELPKCDEETELFFYVKDWSEIREDYYYKFVLGFYKTSFINDNFKLFVESSKGYSCEHHPKNVIAWKEIIPPEVDNA